MFPQQPRSPFLRFVPSFLPSILLLTNIPALPWLEAGDAEEDRTVPVLRERQAGTHQLPFPSLLCRLGYRSGPWEGPWPRMLRSGQEVPEGETHRDTRREGASRTARVQKRITEGEGKADRVSQKATGGQMD